MSKFKVGDHVKLKSESFVESDNRFGYSGEGFIKELNCKEKLAEVQWDEDKDYWWYYENELQAVESIPKKIKSDGGSSSYYDLPISDKLLKAINSRNEDGKCYVKTEDLIDELFGNDFDFGTMFKSVVRGYLQTKGEGKAGNDLAYEMNKVIYYANKIKEKGCGKD